ncbi:MAG: modulator of FtsH protease [Acidobacteriota bacterium]|jgi:FtsH-binding integral membrane protein|nr:modulator of FtsH protease [Acidobacteriota bacterium]
MKDFQSRNQRFEQQPGWQQQQPGAWGSYGMETAARASVEERMGFVRKVYALFFAATLFAVAGVGVGLAFPPIMLAILAHPWLSFFALMGGVMGAQAVRLVPGVNLLALFAFTAFTGVFISPIIAIYTRLNPASIWQAGLLTVGIFGGLTAYVFLSKKDFSFMRGMVTTGLIVVVLAGVLNLFIVGSSALAFGISCAALLLFSGFVLYDTSNIIRRYPVNEYVAGALSLYLDAFNIFLALLRILNAGRR